MKQSSRTSNLQRAREIRSAINAELANMRDGHITIQDVLKSPQDYEMIRLDVYDVLIHVPKLGKAGVKKLLLDSKIWPHDKFWELTNRQREGILCRLPPRVR